MTEDKKPFTVKDRRHFTAEGETREEDSSPQESPRPAPAATAATAATAEPPRPRAGGASAGTGGQESARPTLDFAGLLLSLGAQASLLLGMAEEDEGGPPPDLPGAQAIIALLEVLREKTEGRRTEDEERILQGILYELRMAYVSRTRAGGA
jgi:uncharacterized protein DUF1844